MRYDCPGASPASDRSWPVARRHRPASTISRVRVWTRVTPTPTSIPSAWPRRRRERALSACRMNRAHRVQPADRRRRPGSTHRSRRGSARVTSVLPRCAPCRWIKNLLVLRRAGGRRCARPPSHVPPGPSRYSGSSVPPASGTYLRQRHGSIARPTAGAREDRRRPIASGAVSVPSAVRRSASHSWPAPSSRRGSSTTGDYSSRWRAYVVISVGYTIFLKQRAGRRGTHGRPRVSCSLGRSRAGWRPTRCSRAGSSR